MIAEINRQLETIFKKIKVDKHSTSSFVIKVILYLVMVAPTSVLSTVFVMFAFFGTIMIDWYLRIRKAEKTDTVVTSRIDILDIHDIWLERFIDAVNTKYKVCVAFAYLPLVLTILSFSLSVMYLIWLVFVFNATIFIHGYIWYIKHD